MSFIINTTIDKSKEFLDALRDSYLNDLDKDVYLISNNTKIGINSYVLALASDFFFILLKDAVGKREINNVMVPDVRPEILKKVVEYIYTGFIPLETRFMGEFIEACNLLQLKATISCERKLVFDTPSATGSTGIAGNNQNNSNIASIMADFDDNIKYQHETEYEIKPRTSNSGQIVEVYEISNIEDADITYDGGDDTGGEENYELLNVVPTNASTPLVQAHSIGGVVPKVKKERKKLNVVDSSDLNKPSPKMPARVINEAIIEQAINEVITNNTSFRIVSDKYQIPKTLLWRRARKQGYVKMERKLDEVRLQAIESIKQGESLVNLSKRFNIPISTLHREKLKLYDKGLLPDNVNLKNRSRGEDYEERLRCAIAEILNGKSQNEVAKKYNIPKTTIWRIIKKANTEIKIEPMQEIVTPNSDIVQQLLLLSKRRSIKMEPNEGTSAIEIDKVEASEPTSSVIIEEHLLLQPSFQNQQQEQISLQQMELQQM